MREGQPAQTRDDAQRLWHALHAEEALAAVESRAEKGLPAEEARRRLERFGPNALPEPERRSLGSVFLSQFKSPLIYLLFVAAGVALAVSHVSDAAVIFTVVVLNALIGTFQEGRAERSLHALRKLTPRTARIVRDGLEQIIEGRELVPGDIVVLEAGDAVAADARLLDGARCRLPKRL